MIIQNEVSSKRFFFNFLGIYKNVHQVGPSSTTPFFICKFRDNLVCFAIELN